MTANPSRLTPPPLDPDLTDHVELVDFLQNILDGGDGGNSKYGSRAIEIPKVDIAGLIPATEELAKRVLMLPAPFRPVRYCGKMRSVSICISRVRRGEDWKTNSADGRGNGMYRTREG